MKKFLSKILPFLILCSLLVSLPKINRVYATESTAPEKTLTFLKDVVMLNITEYDAQLSNYFVAYPSNFGGLGLENVQYTLESNESKLYVNSRFRNDTLVHCKLRVDKGSALYTQPPSTNVLDTAEGLLQRYQNYAGASYLEVMREMLDTVDEIANMTTTSGDVKLTISTEGDEVRIDWIYTSNGIDMPRNKVSLRFENGALKTFMNDWNLYKVGSTDINVSEEEAIGIARGLAENYTLRIYYGSNLTEVAFKILEEPVIARFSMVPGREPLTLCPYWHIQLCFDKLYGSATGIEVGIWADTKEVVFCQATGISGSPPDIPPPPTYTDQTPPTISMQWLENKTYIVNNVSLTFAVNEPTSWLAYSLDGQANLTITGNTTLSGLPEGSHSLTIYAEDSGGNVGASETVYFTIAQQTESAEPFPTWIVAVIVIIAIVGVATLIYFGRRRKTTKVKEVPEGVM